MIKQLHHLNHDASYTYMIYNEMVIPDFVIVTLEVYKLIMSRAETYCTAFE